MPASFFPQICLVVLLSSQTASEAGADREVGCGAAALCVAARLCEVTVSPAQLNELFRDRVSALDLSLAEIKAAGGQLGLSCVPVSTGNSSDLDTSVPVIVSIQPSSTSAQRHFIVLYGGSPTDVQVLDYPWRPRAMPRAALDQIWDGKGLYILPRRNDRSESAVGQLPNHIIEITCVAVVAAGLVLIYRSIRGRSVPHAETEPS